MKQKKNCKINLSCTLDDKELAEKVRLKTGKSWSELFIEKIKEILK